MTKLRVLDLFCGAAGAWSYGLHQTGAFETVAACEADPWRRERFLSNNPGVRMYDDVRTLTAERLRADGAFPDIVVGSPPCQDASAINRAGTGIDGERTGLFRDAVRLVRELRPNWACFENVPGLGHRGLDRVLGWLDDAGYRVWTHDMGAEDVGSHCERRRLWILARAKEGKGRAAGQPRQAVPHALARVPGDRPHEWSEDRNVAAGRHLRVAAGLPSRLARQIGDAYGDATPWHHAWMIGRAILHVERPQRESGGAGFCADAARSPQDASGVR